MRDLRRGYILLDCYSGFFEAEPEGAIAPVKVRQWPYFVELETLYLGGEMVSRGSAKFLEVIKS